MLGIPVLLALALLIFTLVLRWTLKNDVPEKMEVFDSRDATMADFDAFQGHFSNSTVVIKPSYECAVCSSLTSTRCSRCKTVRYCSSKCQIIHWRQGHKFECNPQGHGAFEGDHLSRNAETTEQCETYGNYSADDYPRMDEKNTTGQLDHDVLDSPVPRLSTVTIDSFDTDIGRSSSGENGTPFSDINAPNMDQREDKSNKLDSKTSMGLGSTVKKLKREKSRQGERRKSRSSNSDMPSGIRKGNLSDGTVSGNIHNFSKSKEVPYVDIEGQKHSQKMNHGSVNSLADKHSGNSLLPSRSMSSSQVPYNGFKSSLQKVVHHFKTSHQKKPPLCNSSIGTSGNHNYKSMFQHDAFLKLYSSNDVELEPFGLTNCGNSCYANAVLQCLAYTRPLTMYLLQGLHSKECWKDEWCFVCEFEHLILKGREGYTPLSPIRILSNISHLGHGREEDAHEFLRYAVDTMQSVCAELAGLTGPVAEHSTLVGMTFGGFLHSKIRCMKCHNKSEIYERMMDLTVEIDGDVRTLEQALRRFTASEMLEGDNKYYCNRCKSYEKAKKKLTVFQAPNILTIVLKRFQVISVDLERVLSEEAYMLLYARDSPMLPASGRNSYNGKPGGVNFEAATASCSEIYAMPKVRHGSSDASVDPLVMQRESSKSSYAKEPSYVEEWVTHSVESIPRVDSSSEISSLFSYSEEGTCSTPSTKDSASVDDFSDYIFGKGSVAGR
ncbi:ubiquitin carboxyl-terminal hydrolase 16 isoform X2 [Beta vulgaris subsp. vulgaris]|uniref:ubiquitin carboxyl-terminal hydrolase 16 isoform X2 n=1 Tax=Beta vulgaris subsp. vulgaris TaxID=3555 RepID=UPI002036E544|nr:ubiquitin carboxyl-terminal hydrolase 16 isoform X2 [Beta vulgaris subsp. vulgaris]